MRKIESDCYDCGLESAVCDHCPQRRVEHFYCDRCNYDMDPDEIYIEDGQELCEDCLKELHRKKEW